MKLSMLRALAHFLLALPLSVLLYFALTQQLGTDPAEELVKQFGFIAACLLWLTLAMTPLKILSGWPGWVGFRRLLGLWSFLYVCLHLLSFVGLWAGFQIPILLEEIGERPYIIVGAIAWLLMLPLAVTSTRKARRSMGKKWNNLHKVVYLVALLVMLHIFWIAKLDLTQPMLFGVVLSALFLVRINFKNKSATR